MSLKQTNLSADVKLTEEGDDIPSDEVVENESHIMSATIDKDNGDIYFNFSSRLAMYDFAKNLLHEALYSEGEVTELYPLGYEGQLKVVNGVRLTLDSSRVFIGYPPVNPGST